MLSGAIRRNRSKYRTAPHRTRDNARTSGKPVGGTVGEHQRPPTDATKTAADNF